MWFVTWFSYPVVKTMQENNICVQYPSLSNCFTKIIHSIPIYTSCSLNSGSIWREFAIILLKWVSKFLQDEYPRELLKKKLQLNLLLRFWDVSLHTEVYFVTNDKINCNGEVVISIVRISRNSAFIQSVSSST